MDNFILNKKVKIIILILWFLLTTYFLIKWIIDDKSYESGFAIMALFASNIFSYLIPIKKDTFAIHIIKDTFKSKNLIQYGIDIEYPTIIYDDNTRIEKKINNLIEIMYTFYDVDIKNRKIIGEDLGSFTSFYDRTFQAENILSIRFMNDVYSVDAAHSNLEIITLNINLFNGEEFEFKDIFRSAGYKDIENVLKKKLSEHEHNDAFNLESIHLRVNQNFYIDSNNNLFITFFKYEIAPGVCGPIEIEIPFPEYKEFINPNGPLHPLYNKYVDSSIIEKGHTLHFLFNQDKCDRQL